MDGSSFNTIGSVAVQGDGQQSYTFTENMTVKDAAYYRIKQTDRNSRFTYSNILTLRATVSAFCLPACTSNSKNNAA